MSDIFLLKPENFFVINVYTIGYDKQGESIYITIESKSKEFFYDILIDCYKTDKNRTMELLTKVKTNKGIDCICLSHYHDDHFTGLDEILKEYSVRKTIVVFPDVDCEQSLSNSANEIRNQIANIVKNGRKNMGQLKKICDPNTIIDDNIYVDKKKINLEITAISPISNITMRNVGKDPKEIEQNDYSISLLISLGNLKLLFTGDTMNNTLHSINDKYDINFLKIPHHGSIDSDKIFNIVNMNSNTVCVATNYKPSKLPNIELLNKYSEVTEEIYITKKHSEEDFGIIHTRYELNINNDNLIYDTKQLYGSQKYSREQVWTY